MSCCVAIRRIRSPKELTRQLDMISDFLWSHLITAYIHIGFCFLVSVGVSVPVDLLCAWLSKKVTQLVLSSERPGRGGWGLYVEGC